MPAITSPEESPEIFVWWVVMSSVSIFNIYYYIQQCKQPLKGQYLSG